MKKLLLILLLLTGCSNISESENYPKLKTLQINYIQDEQEKHLFLNVRQIAPSQYIVLSEEYSDEAPNFLITEIFDYNVR